MQIINNIFYIILFTTVIGASFTIISLLLNYVFRINLPLWFSVLGMMLYVFPVPAPGLFLVSPETQVWIRGYYIACMIWVCGVILFVLYNLTQMLFAHQAIKSYRICDEEYINRICAECVRMTGLNNIPKVYFGTLEEPACVTGALRPAIILKEEVVNKLTEEQLMTVLMHEVMHIKRKHLIFGKICEYVCILNWFNPLAWVAKKEFDVSCETDCDKKALLFLKGKISEKEYALTMLHLLELSATQVGISGNSFGALGFLLTKQRITLVLNRQSRLQKVISTAALCMAVFMILCFSFTVSRGHFYPYPAYDSGVEYSDSDYFLLNRTTYVVYRRQII